MSIEKTQDNPSSQKMLDEFAYLNVRALMKIWGIKRVAVARRLRNPKLPFHKYATKTNGRDWEISTVDFKRAVRETASIRNNVFKDHLSPPNVNIDK